MKLLGYNVNNSTASESAEEYPERYHHFATITFIKDDNGQGTAQLRMIDKDGVIKSTSINDWELSSVVEFTYGWKKSELFLRISDPKGIIKNIDIDIEEGSRSAYWGVSLLSATMKKVIEVSRHRSWSHYLLQVEILKATEELNKILLEEAAARAKLKKLKMEYTELQ
ncbi:hypothetical protein [Pedobacter cryotolerans]|uniref:Uncharacterized protein n=1 Tax=Pedobacter cryotolerans TaxID=2571270 RepID=A0A4U1BZV6_9SPHI|nr:hypothetical protein [Pedobacter cryotolerans]TKB96174.1 hypothetical protein FA045_18540 [Pedobacter cryotolerans]